MKIRVMWVLLMLGLHGAGWAQTAPRGPSALPVDLSIPIQPSPVRVAGQPRAFYELHLSNFSPMPFSLSKLAVYADGVTAPLLQLSGAELDKILVPIGVEDESAEPARLPAGGRLVAFIDTPLPATAVRGLHHRLEFSLTRPDGERVSRTLEGAPVALARSAGRVLRAPLQGGGWIATDLARNAPGSHWRTLMSVDGKVRSAQRFAIDWVRMNDDGRLFHDDVHDNRNWYGYGAPVLAVADALVSDLRDGVAENTPAGEAAGPVTLDSIAGNYLMLDLGDGRYALYAHLQPGSLQVKRGQRVRAGQVLARLGNSGNSDAPHLHFHMVDGNSPLGAEGLPCSFERFTVRGQVPAEKLSDETLFSGESVWRAAQDRVQHRQAEMPVDDGVIEFP